MAKAGVFSAQREAFAADVGLLRPGFAAGYERIDAVSDETLRAYVGPLFATPEATRALERWLVSFDDTSQTREIEPLLRKLTAPTLIVWGTGDHFFPLKWAYWLKGAIPGARQVVELEGAKLFFPEERPDELADAVRAHWRTSADAAWRLALCCRDSRLSSGTITAEAGGRDRLVLGFKAVGEFDPYALRGCPEQMLGSKTRMQGRFRPNEARRRQSTSDLAFINKLYHACA